MLLPVFLDDGADIGNYLDGAVTNVLLLIVHQRVQQGEHRPADALVTHFAEVLSDQSDERSELI